MSDLLGGRQQLGDIATVDGVRDHARLACARDSYARFGDTPEAADDLAGLLDALGLLLPLSE